MFEGEPWLHSASKPGWGGWGVCLVRDFFLPQLLFPGPPKRGAQCGQGAREAPLHRCPETRSFFENPTKCPCSAPGGILFLQVKGSSLPRAPHSHKNPCLHLRCC